MAATHKEAKMTRHIPDDIRYMSHEVRVAEGYMAPKVDTTPLRDTEWWKVAVIEAKLAGYKARKAGDDEAYEAAVADLRRLRTMAGLEA